MNYVKQLLFYRELTNMSDIQIDHSHLFSMGVAQYATTDTIRISKNKLLVMVSRITEMKNSIERVGYKLSVVNNGALRHAPKLYNNSSVLARRIFDKYKEQNLIISSPALRNLRVR